MKITIYVHTLGLSLGALVLLFIANPSFAQDCSGFGFQANKGVINLEATGLDDHTDLIQCALFEARDMGYPKVKLANGEYNISDIRVQDFEGTLEGSNRANTVINIMDGSIDCADFHFDGEVEAAFKFIEGKPRVGLMTVNLDLPCDVASNRTFYAFHFTGENPDAGCDNDVIHGQVDRVDLVSTTNPFTQETGAVAFGGEGAFKDNCKDTLLGTAKVNRSTITGFYKGVTLTMRASAQVDINFNTFTDNSTNVNVINASQLLTVQENEFIRNVSFTMPFYGVHVWTDNENAPPKNRVVVHRNTFTLDVDHDTGIPAIGIWLTQNWQDFGDQLSFVATNNTFDMDGTQAQGIHNVNYIDGLAAYNEFKGLGEAGVYLGTDQGRPVTGWSLVGNDFGNLDPRDGLWDVQLDFWTENILVGQLQRADVMDFGSNNIVLDQFPP